MINGTDVIFAAVEQQCYLLYVNSFFLKTGSIEEDPYTSVSFKALCDGYDHKETRICYNMKSVFKLT
jgi:hypothetical protein